MKQVAALFVFGFLSSSAWAQQQTSAPVFPLPSTDRMFYISKPPDQLWPLLLSHPEIRKFIGCNKNVSNRLFQTQEQSQIALASLRPQLASGGETAQIAARIFKNQKLLSIQKMKALLTENQILKVDSLILQAKGWFAVADDPALNEQLGVSEEQLIKINKTVEGFKNLTRRLNSERTHCMKDPLRLKAFCFRWTRMLNETIPLPGTSKKLTLPKKLTRASVLLVFRQMKEDLYQRANKEISDLYMDSLQVQMFRQIQTAEPFDFRKVSAAVQR